MPIFQASALNTTNLTVPDTYVSIVPPSTLALNGVPSNMLGVVGSAAWGPVNVPTALSSMSDYVYNFGQLQNRKFDAGTAVAVAAQQGANNIMVVRVTDGSDVAASAQVQTNCITFTAKHTGSLGNSVSVTLESGAKANTYRAVVQCPGYVPEVFDNIGGGGSTFWSNLATTVNNGQNALRGPSNFVVATAGSGTLAPALAASTLSGGTDGVGSLTATTLIGSDPGVGMYALRNSGIAVLNVADMDDSTLWTNVDAFAQGEQCYAVQTMPAGTSVSAGIALKQTAGLDSYSSKLMHGDWIYWIDSVNGVTRLVSPAHFAAGRLANLSPQFTTLNQRLGGVSGSQRSGLSGSSTALYSNAELTSLVLNGIDVITNPGAGGLKIWTCRTGHNSSSDITRHSDSYPTLINYIAKTLNTGMGQYLGNRAINRQLYNDVTATLTNFLASLAGNGLLSTTDGSTPYAVACSPANNPPAQAATGLLVADVQCVFPATVERFLVNLQGGQTINITQVTQINQ